MLSEEGRRAISRAQKRRHRAARKVNGRAKKATYNPAALAGAIKALNRASRHLARL